MKNKKVIFYDGFEVKSDRWKEDTFSFYKNGTYHMYPRSITNDFCWVSLHISQQFKNFMYESEAQWLGGRIDTGYGLAFRSADSENTYVYSITQNKYYSLGLLKKGKFKFITEWKFDKRIKSKNTLGVACVNNYISIYINGNIIESVYDNNYGRGYFGFFSGANVHSKYDNVKIYEIDDEVLVIP